MSNDDPWDARYSSDSEEDEETIETGESDNSSKTKETSKTSKTGESDNSSKTSKSNKTIRSRKNINMYLPEQLVDELQLRYSELNVEWRREHGEDMPKNAEYYPAVIRASLNDTTVAEELDLNR
jgi:hypothetical protein